MSRKRYNDDELKLSVPKIFLKKYENEYKNITSLRLTSTDPTPNTDHTPSKVFSDIKIPTDQPHPPDITQDTVFPDLIPINCYADETPSASHSDLTPITSCSTKTLNTTLTQSNINTSETGSNETTTLATTSSIHTPSTFKADPKPRPGRKANTSKKGPKPTSWIVTRSTKKGRTKFIPKKFQNNQASHESCSNLVSSIFCSKLTHQTPPENPKTGKSSRGFKSTTNLNGQTSSTFKSGPKQTAARSGRKPIKPRSGQKTNAARLGRKPIKPRLGQITNAARSGRKPIKPRLGQITNAARSGRKPIKPRLGQITNRARSGRKPIKPRSGIETSAPQSRKKPTTSRSDKKLNTAFSDQKTFTPRSDLEWAIPAKSNELPEESSYSMQFLRAMRKKYPKNAEKIQYAFIVFKKVKYLVQWKPEKEGEKENGDVVDAEIAALLWPDCVKQFLHNANSKRKISLTSNMMVRKKKNE